MRSDRVVVRAGVIGGAHVIEARVVGRVVVRHIVAGQTRTCR